MLQRRGLGSNAKHPTNNDLCHVFMVRVFSVHSTSIICYLLVQEAISVDRIFPAGVHLLGVLFQSNFKMDMHVQNILTQYTQRMYLIKLLKHQGMPQQQLSVITYSIIVSRIQYALPAWGGFLTVELKTESMPFSSALDDLVT